MKHDGFRPGLIIGFIIGYWATMLMYSFWRADFRKQAIEHDAAEWVVDQSDGSTTFQWKEKK